MRKKKGKQEDVRLQRTHLVVLGVEDFAPAKYRSVVVVLPVAKVH